jgi:hypothetical protein
MPRPEQATSSRRLRDAGKEDRCRPKGEVFLFGRPRTMPRVTPAHVGSTISSTTPAGKHHDVRFDASHWSVASRAPATFGILEQPFYIDADKVGAFIGLYLGQLRSLHLR